MVESYQGRKGTKSHFVGLQIIVKGHEMMTGHRVIDLAEKSPDAIEVYVDKDGKIVVNCLELMSANTKSVQWRMNQHIRYKEECYKNLGFDNVIVYTYNNKTPILA